MNRKAVINFIVFSILIGLIVGGVAAFLKYRSVVSGIIAEQYLRYGLYRTIGVRLQEFLWFWLKTTLGIAGIFIASWFVIQCVVLPSRGPDTWQDQGRKQSGTRYKIVLLYLFRGMVFLLTGALLVLNLWIFIDRKIYRPKGPNVLFIGIDTLRPDHLHCYGYDRQTSPHIDALAKQGSVFLNAYSHIPGTTPSFTSVFTGKVPISQGVLDNWEYKFSLKPKYLTLAEILANQGYRTAAFVSGWTLKKPAGLTQGFDAYSDNFHADRNAAVVNAQVLPWLDSHGDTPFFLFVHYFDPHGQYVAPPPFNGAFPYTLESKDISRIPAYQKQDSISDPSFYISQYDAEIKYTDYHIGRLLGKLASLGLENNTLIVLFADHGETLTEHADWFTHGCYVYEEEVRVPLMFHFPGVIRPQKINGLVSLTDILPTILDMLDVNAHEVFDGKSLKPFLDGKILEPETMYYETARGNPRRNKGIPKGVRGKLFALRDKDWKLIYSPKERGVSYELYNLRDDPKETENLIGQNLAIEEKLRKQLSGYINDYRSSGNYSLGNYSNLTQDLPSKDIEALKSLGYM